MRMSSDPLSSQIATTSSIRREHSCSGPSSSISSAALRVCPSAPTQPAPAISSEARIESSSIISIAAGTTPSSTTLETTSPAARAESKKATSVRTASGVGMTRSQTFVAIPSVPSDPTNAPTRS